MLLHCRDFSFTSLLCTPVQNTSPGVELHNKLNWINKNTWRERFHLPTPFSVINLSQAVCSLLHCHGWDNSQCNAHTSMFTHMYINLFNVLWLQLFLHLHGFTGTSSAVHSQPMVGMSSKEEEAASSRAAGNG